MYRNKTYICFDAGSDIGYYRLMQAWKASDNTSFNFYNAHDLNVIRSWSTEETIKRNLRERLNNSKNFIVLIGEKTKNLFKYVRWEIELACEMQLPIISVNLNKNLQFDKALCPPILHNQLAIHVGFYQRIIEHALSHWKNQHRELLLKGDERPYFYSSEQYQKLGILPSPYMPWLGQ